MTATVSAKGQLVIPAAIRKRYKLTPKSKVEILDTGYSIVITPAPRGEPFLASRGLLKGKVGTKDCLKIRREERQREARNLR